MRKEKGKGEEKRVVREVEEERKGSKKETKEAIWRNTRNKGEGKCGKKRNYSFGGEQGERKKRQMKEGRRGERGSIVRTAMNKSKQKEKTSNFEKKQR